MVDFYNKLSYMSNKLYFILFFCFYYTVSFSQKKDPLRTIDFQNQKKWVDSTYNSMTLKEKVGQLFVVQLMTKNDNSASVYKQISDHSIGGVMANHCIILPLTPIKELNLMMCIQIIPVIKINFIP